MIDTLVSADSIWILIIGSSLAISASLLGSLLLLRKMTMIGDAISHAALPGIVIAFLISGSRSPAIMLSGAVIVGIITTLLIEFLSKRMSVREDSGIGITFTALFAIGIILLTYFADNVDLDQECVLYGEIAYAPLDTISLLGWIIPRSAMNGFLCLLVSLSLIILFYKELHITTFDPAYATTSGIQSSIWHYALMSAVSVITVLSFESVGAILIVALLVAPATAAYMLARRLQVMFILSAICSIITTIAGYILSVSLDSSIAGSIAVAGGFVVAIATIISKFYKL
jgi:manganese/zinc/iron transport system permease protein